MFCPARMIGAATLTAVCLSAASPAAACFQHTFEPCAVVEQAKYTLEVDRKTGRTWVKARESDADGALADLAAAAAKNLPTGRNGGGAPSASTWATRVNLSSASAR
jgi:hypothetical protein